MRYTIERLSILGRANSRYSSLSRREVCCGGRTIGGDKGDIEFQGFSYEGEESVLSSPILVTGLELTGDEANSIAADILRESIDSIGLEAIEHS